jgi:hypothetical protein
LRVEHGFSIVRDHYALDEVQRHDLALGVLALAGFHGVQHQDSYIGDVALEYRADFHRFSHDAVLSSSHLQAVSE